jgi:RNA polymerase sigma-70 factor, ECF subfamily
MMSSDDEADLIARSRGGDGRAYGVLIERHQRVLFNVALRMVGNYEDARDLTQIVFIKAYENLGRFDTRHRYFSWVYRIMVHESLNWIRRGRRAEPLREDMAALGKSPAEECEEGSAGNAISSALMELTVDYRTAIILRHFLELSYREMSDLLEIPEQTVKSRLHTARRILAGLLAKRGVAHA